jgi:DNA polymerase I-like protein with 3'-5' exonuclease and polymerase domains
MGVQGKGTGTSGILTWRGSILKTQNLDKKAIPTLHPAALLRAMKEQSNDGSQGGLDPRYQYIWRMDLARAFEEATNPLFDIPNPHLEVVRDHVNLLRFFDRYRGQEIAAIDIEVIEAIPIGIGMAFNNWHGISVPLLDVMSWQNLEGISESELIRLWQILAQFLDGQLAGHENVKIIGQNFKFDHNSLHNICKMRIKNVYADIMIMAHSLYPEFEKRLSFHTSLWTRHPFYKDDGKTFKIGGRENIIKFLQYNARDAVVTRELFDCFWEQAGQMTPEGFPNWRQEFMFDYAMKLHDFYRRMESVGLKTNLDRQKELIVQYLVKMRDLEMDLRATSGVDADFNFNSHPQVHALLFKKPGEEGALPCSMGLPKRDSADEDTLVALAGNSCKTSDQKRTLELILDWRRTRKAIGTYFVAKADYDGRMRTGYRICGTETGRSSTGIIKPPVRPIKCGLAFQTLTKHGEIGPEIRSEFDADEGYYFVETDMSQAEARLVALLGDDEKTLDLFARKVDIHTLTASWIFGVPPEQITPELRFIGKTTRHAGNYGMGKNRLMHIVNTDAKKFGINISISEWKAGKILSAFHKFAPNIQGVFHPAVEEALRNNNRVLVNPFGRVRQFFGTWGDSLFKEGYAHIPQSTVPDHLRRAGMRVEGRLHDAGIYPLMTNFDSIFAIEAHDAFIALIKEDQVDAYVKLMHEEIERPIDFSRCTIKRGQIVIPAESKIGRS